MGVSHGGGHAGSWLDGAASLKITITLMCALLGAVCAWLLI